jgi:hypothetical protein
LIGGDGLARIRPFELRVAAGTLEAGLTSSVWRVWQGKNNDDVYIAPRPMAGALKASLHPNRYCYYGFPKPYAERLSRDGHYVPPNRAFAHWWRPITPDRGVVWAVEIWLPPGPAFKIPEEKDGKTIELLDPPPAGQAVVLGIGSARISAAAAALPVGVRNLGGSLLSTGDNVVVLAGNVSFDKEAFKVEVEPRINASITMGHFLVSEDRMLGSQHPRATIYNDPKIDGVLKIFDFGIAISRSR